MSFQVKLKMARIIQTVLLIFLVGFARISQAESPFADCPDLFRVGRSCFEVIKNPRPGILAEKHRNVMGFVLGRDSFEHAKTLLGDVNVWHSGDASTSEDKICYVADSGKQQAIMVLASNSEMSMGAVDEVRFLKGEVAFKDRCSKVKLPLKNLQTKSGLFVGMPVKKMKEMLGRPTEEKKELIVYSFYDMKELTPEDPLYSQCEVGGKSTAVRSSGVTAGVARGFVQWLVIWFGPDYVC